MPGDHYNIAKGFGIDPDRPFKIAGSDKLYQTTSSGIQKWENDGGSTAQDFYRQNPVAMKLGKPTGETGDYLKEISADQAEGLFKGIVESRKDVLNTKHGFVNAYKNLNLTAEDVSGYLGYNVPVQAYRSPPTPGSSSYIEDLTRNFDSSVSGKQISQEDYYLKPGESIEQYNSRIAGLRGETSSTAPTSTNFQNSKNPVYTNPIAQTSDAERNKLRKQELDRIKKELEGGLVKPTPYKSLAEFDRLREEKGVVNDEEELAAIQNEARLGKEELRKFSSTAGQGVSEGGRIGAVSEAERNLSFRVEGLALREQAVVDRLNTKNAYINTALNLGQSDYTNAVTEYNNAYSKNLKAIELYNSDLDDQQKDALTGITTMLNLLKDKNISFETLDLNTKTQLQTLSLKAGIPMEIIEQSFIAGSNDKIQTVNSRTDADGTEYYDILKIKPDGTMYVDTVERGLGKIPSNTEDVKSGNAVFSGASIAQGQSMLDSNRGSDNYTNSALYLQMLNAWKTDGGLEQDFFKSYPPRNYVNPNDASVPRYIRDMLKVSEDNEPLF